MNGYEVFWMLRGVAVQTLVLSVTCRVLSTILLISGVVLEVKRSNWSMYSAFVF